MASLYWALEALGMDIRPALRYDRTVDGMQSLEYEERGGTKGMSVTGRHRKRSDPRRRIVRPGSIAPELKSRWNRIRYQGSAHHKSKPTGGALAPSPRQGKSLCDGLRIIGLREAAKLLRAGIARDMVSERRCAEGLPKYIWAVDNSGEAYEAVQGSPSHHYHGYRLDRNDAMREIVVKEWRRRDNT